MQHTQETQSFSFEPDKSDIPLKSLKLLTVDALSSSASKLSCEVSNNAKKFGGVGWILSDDDDKLSCRSLVSVFGEAKLYDGVGKYPIVAPS